MKLKSIYFIAIKEFISCLSDNIKLVVFCDGNRRNLILNCCFLKK